MASDQKPQDRIIKVSIVLVKLAYCASSTGQKFWKLF